MIYLYVIIDYIRTYLSRGDPYRNNTTRLLKDWVIDIDPRYTSTLLSALRGCDSGDKNSKKVTQMLRYLITNDVGKKSSYMSDYIHSNRFVVNTVLKEYPGNKHWVDHVLSAANVIINNHPEVYVRAYWRTAYIIITNNIKKLVKAEADRKALEDLQNSIISKYYEIYMFRGI